MKGQLFSVCLVQFIIISIINAGEDFYSLLGVDKGATVKEIRKAFKKLAISKHPDKNVDDPDAHDEFIKINRAYEVLKDEDLRKKYDQHGEEGLKDDFRQGRRYESWQWYQQNFGIYDDDPEIITLSRTDFEQSVEGTNEPWFINFYSTHCSHCHDLAPTWREVARELEGVIRIGAVNCEDDWQLCRIQNIHSYPSLIFYPQREKYQGDRSKHSLIESALEKVKADYQQLGAYNFKSLVEDTDDNLPWLITFCGEDGDCLEKRTCVKLAAMLTDLVNVGRIDCHHESKLCSDLGHNHGTFYYQSGKVSKDSESQEITSLDARDISTNVLQRLPDVETVTKELLEKIFEGTRDKSWLIHFVDRIGNQNLDLRKLPAFLKQHRVGRAECSTMHSLCNKLHVSKFPSFILFKARGGSEVYYGGRTTAHDIAAFVHDSDESPLENLGPADFPNRVVQSKEPWFVDFFAPWCPPCMRLLPEFRKASKFYGSRVNFGTVDCTVHGNLCNMYNINSYPTTIFYNQSIPYHYHGQHRMQDLLDFISDTLNPRVISLDRKTFQDRVLNKGTDDIWLVDFFAPWCGPCQQLSPEWRKLAKIFENKKQVFVGQVDCDDYKDLCRSQNVNSYPSIRLYPAGSRSGSYQAYNGWHRDASSIYAWAYDYFPSKVTTLTSNNFNSLVLESKQAWIVDFYAPWCGHCQVFKPEFEKVAESIEGFANAGKVDCDTEPDICNKASVRAYPSIRFYSGSVSGKIQKANGMEVDSQNADYLIQFVKQNVPKNKKMDDEL